MRVVSFFNNKGGVGKTTLLCNAAAFLAQKRGFKTLVVDADPQCNATTYMFPDDQIDRIYSKRSGTINDIIKPMKRHAALDRAKVPIIRSDNFGVDVVAGDPHLSLSEDFLAKDWFDGITGLERGLQTTLFLRDFVLGLPTYDYVLFDLGPSLGAINRTVLMASDGFVLPMSSDIFSLRAIENINSSLLEWKSEIEDGIRRFEVKEKEKFTVHGQPWTFELKFLGYVKQQYRAKTVQGQRQPVKAYENIIKKIPAAIDKSLIKGFNGDQTDSRYELGEIPYLQSIVPLSQSAAKPIFGLKAEDGVVGAHFAKVKDFESLIGVVAEQLIAKCEELL
jgi:cellulose biosynthesis protein BcsQ